MVRTSQKTPIAFIVVLLLLLFLLRLAHAQLGPLLCAKQFALANHACSKVIHERQFDNSTENVQIVDEQQHHSQGHAQNHTHKHGHEHSHAHGHKHRHEHEHEHHHENRHGHGHRHRHGQGHGHHRRHPVENEECCRWLKEIDDVCVCAALHRVPLFTPKARHAYTIGIGDTCEVTYRCGGVY